MWNKKHSKIYGNVNQEIVWNIMTDINSWADWHEDLEHCQLEGEFKIGQYFSLKPKGAKAVRIKLTEIEKHKKLTDCTQLFGAKMIDTHELEATTDGLKLTNTLRVTGPLAWLWVMLVARDVAASVPHENDTLIKLAKQHD